ncbi:MULTISPECIES: 23S rRNA (guanine(745)-N(1))-methyltransferase [Providencia]|uniref:23S rRNA (guanine(745)-N(1))-methyltransferase n=1 Tax=Providencia TaxID=586 RepID=UPI001B381821|nr:MULTISPECIES: 23S rRNA (guanine(745)-N(1))-methyltransferase [Providencia]EJD6081580.1 23S rRNA (guanine(745)-N(1))-methyltransferase [Providencia rettgeri]EJD6599911.1 23S rRNA (guanine(745)-N(1))-methyltransferase [Providencia rettgeri]MBQ0330323.1 23S rRNA (guanine(745)-N(1))-methyltransferase [Providencia rettgeri]WOC02411.1 23S rRNA (guanine(745)-N(1))-methyltransferase [Providencia sp. PROV024]
MNYQCPLCFKPLQKVQNSFRCEANHQFDCAKEGYVNLLPVQHKRSKDPGDSAEMMQARRQFLDEGHYHLMRDKVSEKIAQFIPSSNMSLLDIGCGEGYYTDYFAQELKKQDEQATVFGLDVSKAAIRYAAKRYKSVHFCVGTSHRLPFADTSFGSIVRIYAPCKGEELSRILISKGTLITVTPAAEHLQELKALIYDEVKLHPVKEENLPNFVLLDETRLNYKMSLAGSEAYELLAMTPFAWRASEEVKQGLLLSDAKNYTADFLIRVYQYQGE